jgi:hypothetical protein
VPEIHPSKTIRKRVVLHFPGFEGLDAGQHRERYDRSLRKAASLWQFSGTVSPLVQDADGGHFDVDAHGDGWQASSRIHVLDHSGIVEHLRARPLYQRLLQGYRSAAIVVLEGGAYGYFRHAWRFGLFFVFPFLIIASALFASLAIGTYPLWLGAPAWHFAICLPVAYLFFFKIFLPWADGFHVLHLLSDWELAVAVARLKKPYLLDWMGHASAAAKAALTEEADEYVISSHSMGSSMAAHVLGSILEETPDLLAGKQVVFLTLGGAIPQCSLLRSASRLRARVGHIARAEPISWLDIHCLTDVIHFYKCRVVALCGHEAAPQARLVFIRIKRMLTAARYRKIRRDFLRVHRQYVLDSDLQSPFDFALLTAGPLPASRFADLPETVWSQTLCVPR